MEKTKTFDFEKQLKIGNKGESQFLILYPKVKKEDGIKYDFSLNGKTIELKTDTYLMKDTPNVFMEYYSDTKTLKMGGPWRAANDEVDYFVYMYLHDKVCLWYDTVKLKNFLDKYIKTLKYKTVKNRGWSSYGYTIPREAIKHLEIKI